MNIENKIINKSVEQNRKNIEKVKSNLGNLRNKYWRSDNFKVEIDMMIGEIQNLMIMVSVEHNFMEEKIKNGLKKELFNKL